MRKKSVLQSINITRLLYLILCECAGAAIANHAGGPETIWIGLLIALLVAGFFILVESLTKKFTLRGFSNGTVGLLIGFFCAWLLSRGLIILLESTLSEQVTDIDSLTLSVNVGLYASLGFLGAVLALRSSEEDFALLIPYIRFRKESALGLPILIDINAIVDSRLLGILRAGFIGNNLVIPQFVLEELHVMVNSSSPEKSARAKRGLENVEKIKSDNQLRLSIQNSNVSNDEKSNDLQMMHICLLLSTRLLTTDENLAKAARLQGIEVLNINDLTQALKPRVAVGERIQLPLVRTGREEHQAVGYLPDGSMIVVNNAVDKINTTQDIVVISTLETGLRTMVFAELYNPEEKETFSLPQANQTESSKTS